MSTAAAPDIRVDVLLDSDEASLAEAVRAGLLSGQKQLPPRCLYDERGSQLFDRITELPEYYPARCERAILNRYAPEIVAETEAHELVEIGSGFGLEDPRAALRHGRARGRCAATCRSTSTRRWCSSRPTS